MNTTRILQLSLPVSHMMSIMASNVLITAREGGTNYWAVSGKVVHSDQPHDPLNPDMDTCIESVEFEEEEAGTDDTARSKAITRDDVIDAMVKIAFDGDNRISLHAKHKATITNMLMDPENADFDADDADHIIQVALLGDVIYG